MPIESIEIEGLDEIRSRFARFPRRFKKVVKATMGASLLKIWENIPPYPPERPDQTYIRTGLLGRSLGGGGADNQGGGKGQSPPDIYTVEQRSNFTTGEFGSRTRYAPEVIGENQKPVHQGRWWTLKGTVLKKVVPQIEKLWKAATEEIAAWLDGKRL